ncbi:flavodoxin family protein [Flammeovirga pectinis]|uniref:Flavodoxin family protein n=1 Tax=Flammeovirga pectinis TaxID=2494373 RepID=A0A3Q9FQB8_9BACT|nr:NAD(P)H-dependent oxidoreductase [Flammeovirga pectinis]AZQ64654.1 flavodoxin family protein [Flammeovirga pectinis]
MKHLIVFSHLNPESFTKAIVNEVISASEERGDEVKVTDLYSENFDPVLKFPDIQGMFMGGETPSDVKRYQDDISWAEHITFVFPLWWGQMPAMLKGYIDRVFASGFAFKYTETGVDAMLTGKTSNVIIPHGSPTEYYEGSDMYKSLTRIFDGGVFGFCGIKSEITYFGAVPTTSDEVRKKYLLETKNLFK